MNTTEPDEVRAGNTIEWEISLADYLPENGWELRYVLYNDLTSINFTATDSGDSKHLVSISRDDSAIWSPGCYKWESYVVGATKTHQIDKGLITVLENLATAKGGIDDRSHVEKVYLALEAMLEGKALSADQSTYQISDGTGSRSLSRLSPAEIMTWYTKYKYWHSQEKNKREGKSGTNKILLRF